jgi:hypothetical protein
MASFRCHRSAQTASRDLSLRKWSGLCNVDTEKGLKKMSSLCNFDTDKGLKKWSSLCKVE